MFSIKAVTLALILLNFLRARYFFAQIGIGERTGLVLAATIMCTICSLVAYHQGIEEGVSVP
jgi:hypothetical protein